MQKITRGIRERSAIRRKSDLAHRANAYCANAGGDLENRVEAGHLSSKLFCSSDEECRICCYLYWSHIPQSMLKVVSFDILVAHPS